MHKCGVIKKRTCHIYNKKMTNVKGAKATVKLQSGYHAIKLKYDQATIRSRDNEGNIRQNIRQMMEVYNKYKQNRGRPRRTLHVPLSIDATVRPVTVL